MRKLRGTECSLAKMTDDSVREARRLRAEGLEVRELAALYNVSPSTMSDLLRGRTWGHVE